MAIWTSRYSNRELQSGKYYPVGISLGVPKWPVGYEIKEQCYSLAPKGYMLNLEKEQYRAEYFKKLENIGNEKIVDIVSRLDNRAQSEGKELVLLCYEDVRLPDDWCHRTMFAEWWAENVGEEIQELPDPSEPRPKKPAKAAAKKETKKEAKKEPEPQADDGYQQLSLFDL